MAVLRLFFKHHNIIGVYIIDIQCDGKLVFSFHKRRVYMYMYVYVYMYIVSKCVARENIVNYYWSLLSIVSDICDVPEFFRVSLLARGP